MTDVDEHFGIVLNILAIEMTLENDKIVSQVDLYEEDIGLNGVRLAQNGLGVLLETVLEKGLEFLVFVILKSAGFRDTILQIWICLLKTACLYVLQKTIYLNFEGQRSRKKWVVINLDQFLSVNVNVLCVCSLLEYLHELLKGVVKLVNVAHRLALAHVALLKDVVDPLGQPDIATSRRARLYLNLTVLAWNVGAC